MPKKQITAGELIDDIREGLSNVASEAPETVDELRGMLSQLKKMISAPQASVEIADILNEDSRFEPARDLPRLRAAFSQWTQATQTPVDFSASSTGELREAYRAMEKEVHNRVRALEPWLTEADENGDMDDTASVLTINRERAMVVQILGCNDEHFFSPDGPVDLDEGATHVGDLISLLESREA